MSTGYECRIQELKPGAWYYVLQNWNCPVGAWDWTEYASVVGPYPSEDAAFAGLQRNEANPGGYVIVKYEPGSDEGNKTLLLRARKKP